jgi:hypothetical protein
MPKRRSVIKRDSFYLAKIEALAETLGMPPRELEACIGSIVGGLAAAFVLVRKPSGSWLPLMHVNADKQTAARFIEETVSCWLGAGAEKVVVAADFALPKDPLAVESHDFAGVRFTVWRRVACRLQSRPVPRQMPHLPDPPQRTQALPIHDPPQLEQLSIDHSPIGSEEAR